MSFDNSTSFSSRQIRIENEFTFDPNPPSLGFQPVGLTDLFKTSHFTLSDLVIFHNFDNNEANFPLPTFSVSFSEGQIQLNYHNLHEDCKYLTKNDVNIFANEIITPRSIIINQYRREKGHKDLTKVTFFNKTASSVLYELFSKVYKEKPILEINEAPDHSLTLPKFIASHILNDEIIGVGYGTSKKIAKNEACKKSLELLAPSLLEHVILDINLAINKNSKNSTVKYPVFNIDLQAIKDEWKIMFIKEKDQFMKLNKISFQEDIDQGKHSQRLDLKRSEDLQSIKKDRAFESIYASKLKLSQNHLFYDLYISLSDTIQEIEKNCEENSCLNSENCQMALDHYCSKKVFTDLHKMQCILENNQKEMNLINWSLINENYRVYLYCYKLRRNFCFNSPSLETSIEMSKMQLLQAYYPTCERISDILQLIKMRFGFEKCNSKFKAIYEDSQNKIHLTGRKRKFKAIEKNVRKALVFDDLEQDNGDMLVKKVK